jgi:hypothetical protein
VFLNDALRELKRIMQDPKTPQATRLRCAELLLVGNGLQLPGQKRPSKAKDRLLQNRTEAALQNSLKVEKRKRKRRERYLVSKADKLIAKAKQEIAAAQGKEQPNGNTQVSN